jgi:hypothetical protein
VGDEQLVLEGAVVDVGLEAVEEGGFLAALRDGVDAMGPVLGGGIGERCLGRKALSVRVAMAGSQQKKG